MLDITVLLWLQGGATPGAGRNRGGRPRKDGGAPSRLGPHAKPANASQVPEEEPGSDPETPEERMAPATEPKRGRAAGRRVTMPTGEGSKLVRD